MTILKSISSIYEIIGEKMPENDILKRPFQKLQAAYNLIVNGIKRYF